MYMTIIEKQCIGCGNDYLCHGDYLTLYCTRTCEQSHTLFSDEDSSLDTINDGLRKFKNS